MRYHTKSRLITVRRIAAAIAIEAVRVPIALPYAVHHGRITACNRMVSVETGARVRTIQVNGMDLYQVSCDYP